MSNARRLIRQTLTIARRDFVATVFTPTFLIFLFAPLTDGIIRRDRYAGRGFRRAGIRRQGAHRRDPAWRSGGTDDEGRQAAPTRLPRHGRGTARVPRPAARGRRVRPRPAPCSTPRASTPRRYSTARSTGRRSCTGRKGGEPPTISRNWPKARCARNGPAAQRRSASQPRHRSYVPAHRRADKSRRPFSPCSASSS